MTYAESRGLSLMRDSAAEICLKCGGWDKFLDWAIRSSYQLDEGRALYKELKKDVPWFRAGSYSVHWWDMYPGDG